MIATFRTGLAPLCAIAMLVAPVAALSQERYAYVGTSMFGEYEVGSKGADKDASGDFTAEFDMQTGQMCYMLEVNGLDGVTAAHIHKGDKGKNGPPVVTLELASDDKCVDVDPALMKDMANNEAKYYVNVHTEAFPAGAIRGQLSD